MQRPQQPHPLRAAPTQVLSECGRRFRRRFALERASALLGHGLVTERRAELEPRRRERLGAERTRVFRALVALLAYGSAATHVRLNRRAGRMDGRRRERRDERLGQDYGDASRQRAG